MTLVCSVDQNESAVWHVVRGNELEVCSILLLFIDKVDKVCNIKTAVLCCSRRQYGRVLYYEGLILFLSLQCKLPLSSSLPTVLKKSPLGLEHCIVLSIQGCSAHTDGVFPMRSHHIIFISVTQ